MNQIEDDDDDDVNEDDTDEDDDVDGVGVVAAHHDDDDVEGGVGTVVAQEQERGPINPPTNSLPCNTLLHSYIVKMKMKMNGNATWETNFLTKMFKFRWFIDH